MSWSQQNLTFAGRPVPYNFTTWYDPSLCTLDTCPESYAVLQYVPTLGGNAFFLAWYIVILVAQIAIGVQRRTWSFLIAMVGGCILEAIGWAARVLMHNNIFDFNWFLMYLICLTIAPVFFSAAIYLSFTRFILLHAPHLARFKPRTYTIIFIVWDIVSLALQAAGGGLADTAADGGSGQTGINIMIAGLSSQVASLFVFALFCADFAWRVWTKEATASKTTTRERMIRLGSSYKWWVAFVLALIIATVTIFVRSCYRVAELKGGFGGRLANQEVSYMILEGAMIAVAALALTAAHPAFVFGSYWKLKNLGWISAPTQTSLGTTSNVKA